MTIDYSRIRFNEINTDEMPYFVWYDYDISKEEFDEWIVNEVTDDEIPKGIELYYNMELLLTIFSKADYKLQAIVQDIKGNKYEIDLCYQFHNADELITKIPNYESLIFTQDE